MRPVITAAMSVAMLAATAIAAQAQTQRLPDGSTVTRDSAGILRRYDARGHYAGSSERSSNRTTTNHYDAAGRRSGSSERSSDGVTTYQYDAAGRMAGSTVRGPDGSIRRYDAAGRLILR